MKKPEYKQGIVDFLTAIHKGENPPGFDPKRGLCIQYLPQTDNYFLYYCVGVVTLEIIFKKWKFYSGDLCHPVPVNPSNVEDTPGALYNKYEGKIDMYCGPYGSKRRELAGFIAKELKNQL